MKFSKIVFHKACSLSGMGVLKIGQVADIPEVFVEGVLATYGKLQEEEAPKPQVAKRGRPPGASKE